MAQYQEMIRRRALARLAVAPRRTPRPLVIFALGFAIASHMLVVIWLNALMRLKPTDESNKGVQVTIYAEQAPEPPMPEPPIPFAQRVAEPQISRPLTTSTVTTHEQSTHETPPPSELQIFNADGSVRLPSVPPPPPTTHEQGLRRSHELMTRGHNVLHCRAADRTFSGGHHENVGDELARKYLSWMHLYNPHSAWQLGQKEASATAACDD